MGNKQSAHYIPEVTHHKGGTQSLNKLLPFLQKAKSFSCKILLDKTNYGSGFFCKIFSPFENNKIIKVLFTCNHVLKKEYLLSNNEINLEFNEEKRKIFFKEENRLIWTNKELDYTCIEILDKDNIKEFLKIDMEIYEKDYHENLLNEEILLIAYNKDENEEESEQGCEFGILLAYNKEKKRFLTNYNSTPGSSGGAILFKKNYKLIGMHEGGKNPKNNKQKKKNLIIPLNLILQDLNSNKNSLIKFDIINKSNNNKLKPKKKEDSSMNNIISNNKDEINNLCQDLRFFIICKECGYKFGEELEMRQIEFWNLAIEMNKLKSCENCGKNNYGYEIPYNLNLKCNNCGDKLNKEGFPFSLIKVMFFLKDHSKDCDKCGKNDYSIIAERNDSAKAK